MALPKQSPTVLQTLLKDAKPYLSAILSLFELRKLLAAYEREPSFAGKAARDMNDQESFDYLMHLVYSGEVFIDETLKVDPAGKLIQPKPGQQLKVKAQLAGVEFVNADYPSLKYFTPRPVLAIALYKLAKELAGGYYFAKQIGWGGIGHGHEGKKLNCHEIGTCVDIYSVLTRFGKFDVYKDWGTRPVHTAKGGTVKGNDIDPWGDAASTYFRLRDSDPGLASYFFPYLYESARSQFTVGPSDNLTLKEGEAIREGANIFHPDYPRAGLRRSHQEHMHFQIGPSFL